MSDQSLPPTIVGGLFSLLGAMSGVVLSQMWITRREQIRALELKDEKYLNWIRALQAECDHLLECCEKLHASYEKLLNDSSLRMPTRKLNNDVLAGARTEILDHPRSAAIFRSLTSIYRDVQQANEMMNRTEEHMKEIRSESPAKIKTVEVEDWRKTVVTPTKVCLELLRPSLAEMKGKLEEQEKLVIQNREFFSPWLR